MRGRKPIPVEERRLGGHERSHEKLPEPVLAGGRLKKWPEPPAHLPDAAVAFWDETLSLLGDVGILDQVDMPALVLLATQYARAAQCRRVLADQGLFAPGVQGQVIAHPAVAIEQKATQQFFKMAEHYGLTPLARTRLGIAELHAKTMARELEDQLEGGSPREEVDVPDADVVEDADVGLPG